MSGTKRVIYWDTCIYCAWIGEEAAHAKFLPAIHALLKECGEGKAIIVTSVLTSTEVLECKYTEHQYRRFVKAFNPHSHIKQDVDARIAAKAASYRSYYATQEPAVKLLTPDAIHLATAVIYGATELWTFDDGKKEKKGVSLLKLDGNVAGDVLAIKTPNEGAPKKQPESKLAETGAAEPMPDLFAPLGVEADIDSGLN